jgi:hypothetical protein
MSQPEGASDLRVNLIHLPNIDTTEQYADLLSNLRERCPEERWGVHLTRDVQHSKDPLFYDCLGAAATFTLSLCESNGSSPSGVDGRSLGSIDRWEIAVDDPVPIVVRNPNSRLAREYLAVCESVLGQINSLRRQSHIEQPVG